MPLNELINQLRRIINQNMIVDRIQVIDGYPYVFVKGGNCDGDTKNEEEEDRTK